MEKTMEIKLDDIEKGTLREIREPAFLKNEGIESSIISIDGRKRKYFYKSRPVIAKKIIYSLGVPKKSFSKWVDCIGIHLSPSKKVKMVKNIQKEVEKNE